jgi:hypothetical protein
VSRSRRRTAVKAGRNGLQPGPRPPRIPAGAISFTPDQLAAMMNAQRQLSSGNEKAALLPSSPYWETSPFGPGRRLPPAPINVTRPDTGRAEPRLYEYPVSWNLQIDGRRHVPWKTLQDAAEMPLFRKCIERRKGICRLDFTVSVDPKAVARETAITGQAKTDVESAIRKKYTSEIARCTDWLQLPDRKNDYDWEKWTGLLMENRLTFDAVAVYPRMTYGGDVAAFEVIDGKTIKPLLDEYGGRPVPPLPAFQQILYGFPRGEFMATTDPEGATPGIPADQLLYERTIIRPHSPYGMSATEIALWDGLVWMRRMGWILGEYTEGVMPDAYLKVDGATEWSVTQWEDWQRALNDHLGGNTPERFRFPLFPPGVDPVQAATVPERYKPDYDMFLIKLIAGDYGLTATELGFPEVGSLGASFHEGEEDVLNRLTRLPDARWVSGIATRLAHRYLGMPGELSVQILGLESEDEAAADAVAQNQVQSARMTLNEDRARRGLPALPFAEADMAMLMSDRGVVVLDGASKQAPAGTLLQPGTVKPLEPGDPGAPSQSGQQQAQQDDDEDDKPQPKGKPEPTAKAEADALRKWAAKGNRSRPFECYTLTKHAAALLAPELAELPNVVFKDAGPKALAGTGPAGSATRNS